MPRFFYHDDDYETHFYEDELEPTTELIRKQSGTIKYSIELTTEEYNTWITTQAEVGRLIYVMENFIKQFTARRAAVMKSYQSQLRKDSLIKRIAELKLELETLKNELDEYADE